jgi:prepilin-type N-terminal cleavage/methylation domain-containing protein
MFGVRFHLFGFTLIELMITVLVIAAVAMVGDRIFESKITYPAKLNRRSNYSVARFRFYQLFI